MYRARHLLPLLILSLVLLAITSCSRSYSTTFDDAEDWSVETRPDVRGGLENGRYVLQAIRPPRPTTYYATAGKSFSNGIFEVEATQIDGVANSGYGLILRVDEEAGAFYALEISADGYVWIGRCDEGCVGGGQPLLGGAWFRSPAVLTGLDATNRLRINADGPNLIFYVNDIELGRVFDAALTAGDIGLMVETLGAGGIAVAFDNVVVRPLEQ